MILMYCYIAGMAVWFILFCVSTLIHYVDDKNKFATLSARYALLTPLWPAALIAFIIYAAFFLNKTEKEN